jgi:hypothetical protein
VKENLKLNIFKLMAQFYLSQNWEKFEEMDFRKVTKELPDGINLPNGE